MNIVMDKVITVPCTECRKIIKVPSRDSKISRLIRARPHEVMLPVDEWSRTYVCDECIDGRRNR